MYAAQRPLLRNVFLNSTSKTRFTHYQTDMALSPAFILLITCPSMMLMLYTYWYPPRYVSGFVAAMILWNVLGLYLFAGRGMFLEFLTQVS